MAKLITGQELVDWGLSHVGTPYVYGTKMKVFTQQEFNRLSAAYPSVFTNTYKKKITQKKLIGKVCVDCSGLISSKTGKVLGSAQLYQQAYTRLPINKIKDFANGTILWKKGHVGIFYKDSKGKLMCVEAKGIDYGVVANEITDPYRWYCGLTFKDIDYTIQKKITDYSYRVANPYIWTGIVRYGSKGIGVKWVQYELGQAGYHLNIDGDFGKNTKDAVIAFQRSCKIKDDGVVGSVTKSYLEKM